MLDMNVVERILGVPVLIVSEPSIEGDYCVIGRIAIGLHEGERRLLVWCKEVRHRTSMVGAVEKLAAQGNFPHQNRDGIVSLETALVEIAGLSRGGLEFKLESGRGGRANGPAEAGLKTGLVSLLGCEELQQRRVRDRISASVRCGCVSLVQEVFRVHAGGGEGV